MGIPVAGSLNVLATSSLEATALALLAIFLYQVHRRAGLAPLFFLLAALSLLVPFTSQASSLDFGDQGAAPRVHAIVVPVLIATGILLHITMGWKNAQGAAIMPLLAGLLAATAAALSPVRPMLFPSSLLPHGPGGALVSGFTVWVGAVAAIVFFHLLYRISTNIPVLPAFVAATGLGVAVQGAGLAAFSLVGLAPTPVSLPEIIAVPVVVGLVPIAFLAVAAELRLHGLSPGLRRELLRAPPFGSSSLIERSLHAERLYKEGLSEGAAQATTYLELVESDEEGAYVVERDGRILYANRAMATLLDRPGDTLRGENVRLLFAATAKRGPPVPSKVPTTPGSHRARITLPSGHSRSVALRVRRGSDGRIHGHVRDRTGELVRRELKRQQRRAEFYLDLLHTSVAKHIEGPRERLAALAEADGLDPVARANADEGARELGDLEAFLRRIELLGKLESIEASPVDARELLDAAAERFRSRFAPRAELKLDVPSDPVMVCGAPVLAEALNAILDNAVEHGQRDRIEALLRAQPRPDGSWRISVLDDGPGIAQEVRDELAEGNGADGFEHIGLGLHVARTIVTRLGGHLHIEDREPGRPEAGTAVHLDLLPAPRTVGAWGSDESTRDAAAVG